ncbi:hypothetical protein DRQ25_04695 [Candidatus Fermentibacteria bacterium]|nr:MAG: hypothetical protein DRQ25_04695 [Candidatus Fermentibacteria bacterium]
MIDKKLITLKKELGKSVKGRDEVIDGLLLALASQEHILIEGAPGEAKTYCVRLLCEITNLDFFYRQIHNETVVKDIVGILNPLSYQRGEIELIETGFWKADILFFDEFLRGRSEFLDFLLEVMQERKCSKTLAGERNLPVLSVIATTNPLTEDYNTERLDLALKDRFAIILSMDHLIKDNPEAVEEVLSNPDNTHRNIRITAGEIKDIRENAATVKYDTEIILTMFRMLRDEGFVFSTRFIKLYRDLCRIMAAVNGRNQVSDEDYDNVGRLMLNNRFDTLDSKKIDAVMDECIVNEEHRNLVKRIDNIMPEEGEVFVQECVEILNEYRDEYPTLPKNLQHKYSMLEDKLDEEITLYLKYLPPQVIQSLDTEKLRHHIDEYLEYHTRKTKMLLKTEYDKASEIARKTCKNCELHYETKGDRTKIIITPNLSKPKSFQEIRKFESMCSQKNIRLDIML